MIETLKNKVLVVVAAAVVSTTGYGALYLADSRYVLQRDHAAETRAREVRQIERMIDQLEWKEKNDPPLSGTEDWQLRRLKADLRKLQ